MSFCDQLVEETQTIVQVAYHRLLAEEKAIGIADVRGAVAIYHGIENVVDDLLVRNETAGEFEVEGQRMIVGMRIAVAKQLDQHVSASFEQNVLFLRRFKEIALLIGQDLAVSITVITYASWPVDRVIVFQLEGTTHIEPLQIRHVLDDFVESLPVRAEEEYHSTLIHLVVEIGNDDPLTDYNFLVAVFLRCKVLL